MFSFINQTFTCGKKKNPHLFRNKSLQTGYAYGFFPLKKRYCGKKIRISFATGLFRPAMLMDFFH